MANQRIKANLIPSCDIYPVIHLAQYDMSDGTGKQVEIELYYGTDKFTIPSGASVTFRGTKRDKTGYSYAIEKFTDNVVTVDVRPQMTVLSGKHNAELRISKGETISNTIKFVMDIDSSALADDTKVSETDLSVIEKALQASDSAIQAKAEVEKLKESVEASEKNVKLSEANASSASASSSQSAQASAESASSASQSATNAQASAESASTSATTASTKATEAQASAESAIQTKAEIEQLKKETIEQASTLTDSAKQEISTVKDATVTEVTELKNSTVSEITSLKDSTIEAVTLLKDTAKAEADRATESSASAKVQAEKAQASADSIANVTSDVEKLKEDLPNKITKFYASNQGETHITDSDNGKIMDMLIYGKSEQKQYTGKNLLELSDNRFQSGNLILQISQGIITFFGSTDNMSYIQKIKDFIVPSDGTYTISTNSDSNNDSPRILFSINGGTYESSLNGATKELAAADVVSLYVRISTVSSYNGRTIKPMIEKGSEVTSYEPYTGGQPSPSPDYPQEIKSVVNPTIDVLGINLLNQNKINNNTYYPYGLTITYIGDSKVHLSGTYKYTDGSFAILETAQENISGKGYNIKGFFVEGDYKSFSLYGLRTKDEKIIAMNAIGWNIGDEINMTIQVIVCKDSEPTAFTPYTEQSITLPITLNAIPVSSGGNVTIDGQQYIADYVDVEHGKVVRVVDSSKLDNTQSIIDKTEWLLAEKQETDLTVEQTQALKKLVTYYPVTHITVGSEQLYGYTVFNYPISLANGWNYVKQQLNDNRDYIYDMDLQSAEAYVNSEYAVTLTELEV